MQGEIQIFSNSEFGEIRTVVIDGEPWFIAKDISERLGYAQTANMLKIVEPEDKMKKPSSELDDTFSKFASEISLINESGLYDAIFGSKLKNAKKFKRWVTTEVLPSIRKTGGYQMPVTNDEKIVVLAQGHVELRQEVNTIKADIEELKNDMPILPIEADRITTAVKRKGVSVLGGKESNAYKNKCLRQKVYNSIYAHVKYNFGVKSYKSIKRSDVDKAIEIIEAYQPPFFLQQMIENENAQQRLEM